MTTVDVGPVASSLQADSQP